MQCQWQWVDVYVQNGYRYKCNVMLVDTSSVKMDVRRLEIIDKLNSKSSVSDNGQCIMWTGCCKGRGVRYGVMCVNVSLHGPGVWRRVAVHRLGLALMKTPTNFSLNDVLNAQGDHLCHNSLCINASHISLEPHCVNNKRRQCTRKGICQGHMDYPMCKLALVR